MVLNFTLISLLALAATGAVVAKPVLLDQSLVDQKAVIQGGIPEMVKLTPADSLNEPNLS